MQCVSGTKEQKIIQRLSLITKYLANNWIFNMNTLLTNVVKQTIVFVKEYRHVISVVEFQSGFLKIKYVLQKLKLKQNVFYKKYST